jgi:hypothetical protein
MAHNVTAIDNYIKEEVAPIIYDMILKPKTVSMIDGVGNVIPGVKGETKLPMILADPTIQADGCELTATGDDVLTQMTLDVAKMAIMEKVCEKDLETTVFRLKLKNGSNYDSVLLRNEITEELKRRLALKLENLVWQGDTTLTGDANLKWFDGYKKLFKADVNVVTATPSPKVALATAGNARAGLISLYKNIPLEIINDPDTVIFTGLDVVRNYQTDLAAANLYNPALYGTASEIGTLPLENSHLKVVGVAGLNAQKFAVAVNLRNLFVGTDLANEEENIEFTPDPIKKSLFYIQAAWKLGVSYAYGDKVAIYEWS